MSPRAAWRLETLGFERVFDYVGGKADWLAAGLPTEGTGSSLAKAGDVARHDAVTCRLDDRLGDAAEKVHAAGDPACIVVTEGGVVLGRLGVSAFAGDATSTVEEVMEAGPATVRADERLEALVPRMQARGMPGVIVTTPGGVLVGTLSRDDAERRIEEGRRVEPADAAPSCAC